MSTLSVGIMVSWYFWEDLNAGGESLSTTIRNQALLLGGVTGLLLALWRSRVAERQRATAQASLLNDQYQRGADMLGSGALPVRIGGIYVLQRLAREHPEDYHVPVMELFCVFARYPTMDPELVSAHGPIREDVQAVLTAIGGRMEAGIEREIRADFNLELDGADLGHANLREAKLAGASLRRAKLDNAILIDADLSSAVLADADLTRTDATDARLCWADLSKARLHETNLSGAVFQEEITGGGPKSPRVPKGKVTSAGLTDFQLHMARADPDNPPVLNDVVDADDGRPLVWRGNALTR